MLKLGPDNKQRQRLFKLVVIFVIGITLFSILIILTNRIKGSDDTIFQDQISPYKTVFDWTIFRYQSWSGRIFAESFVYIFSSAPIYLWKMATILFYASFSVVSFLYYKLFVNTKNTNDDKIMLALAFTLPFLIDTDVLRFGIFWVTGSMNYFWIITLGLAGFYPLAYYSVRHRLLHWSYITLCTLSLFIAACSQEQVGLILVILSASFTIYEFYKHKKDKQQMSMFMIASTLMTVASFLIGITALGNSMRIKAETTHWLPDFYTTPLIQHIDYGYRWFLEATINHMGLIFALIWGLMALLFIAKQNKTKLQFIITYSLVAVCLLTLSKSYTPIGYWFNFYATWKPTLPNLASYLTFLPWLLIFIGTIITPIILFDKQIKGWLMSLLLSIVFISTGVITLSPTMYASGWRTLFVPSIILVFILFSLISEAITKYRKNEKAIIISVAVFVAFGYLYMAIRLIHGLTS